MTTTVRLASGQTVSMELAERGVWLAGKLWVRELRKLSASGHQTSILATDYVTESPVLAGAMFSRWSQENFFRYMREHYALDRLVDRDLQDLDETTRVVNPAYRRLDGAVRRWGRPTQPKKTQPSTSNSGEADRRCTQFEYGQRGAPRTSGIRIATPRNQPRSVIPERGYPVKRFVLVFYCSLSRHGTYALRRSERLGFEFDPLIPRPYRPIATLQMQDHLSQQETHDSATPLRDRPIRSVSPELRRPGVRPRKFAKLRPCGIVRSARFGRRSPRR